MQPDRGGPDHRGGLRGSRSRVGGGGGSGESVRGPLRGNGEQQRHGGQGGEVPLARLRAGRQGRVPPQGPWNSPRSRPGARGTPAGHGDRGRDVRGPDSKRAKRVGPLRSTDADRRVGGARDEVASLACHTTSSVVLSDLKDGESHG